MKFNAFTKIFTITLLFILLLEVNSYLAINILILKHLVFLTLLAIAFGLTLIKTEYGLYFVMAELAIGGKGYLFDFNGISLRMGLFALVLLGSLINQIKINYLAKKSFKTFFDISKFEFNPVYLLLFIAIAFGIINGLLQNQFANVYRDSNAWLFFLLAPAFWLIRNNQIALKNIQTVLLAATAWLSAKTIFFLYLFSYHYITIGETTYKWVRNTGVGEITYISGNNFRIFFYSQIYCLFAGLIILSLLLSNKIKSKNYRYLSYGAIYLFSLTILISQSRSFWLGAIAGIIALLFFSYLKLKISLTKIIAVTAVLIIMVISQIFLIQIITGSLLNNRLNNLQTEPAGASRLNQLMPLSNAIALNPIFGYGFGKTLTYKTQDPRILSQSPDGNYTTFAFEWGYLDILLKLGLIGFVIYFYFFLTLFYNGILKFELGFLAGLFALGVVNIFTPYLNHPLGIGYILLCSSAILWRQEKI